MCGRYTYLFTWKQLHRLMRLSAWPDGELVPRYNVAPTQMVPVIRADDQGVRYGSLLRWGLVPSWADDLSIGSRMINARAETVSQLPAFRDAFAKRRCLVPMSGFYEWQAIPGSKTKRPFWIGRTDKAPFPVAGIWERWTRGDAPVETISIITTSANAVVAPAHNRMPVILDEANQARWLDPDAVTADLTGLLVPCPDDWLIKYPVSSRVGSPRNDDPGLLEPAN
jgi:putative SOS response-associated peptidase YedK